MADPATIARPYAQACFRLARQAGRLADWSDMLAMIEAVVCDEALAGRIRDPMVRPGPLEQFILAILGDALDRDGRNLVRVLVRNRRIALVPRIRSLYEAARRDHEARTEVKIVSALPIEDRQMRALLAAIEKRCGREVSARLEIDPRLIGGVRIQVGDRMIDGSVRGRLEAMATLVRH